MVPIESTFNFTVAQPVICDCDISVCQELAINLMIWLCIAITHIGPNTQTDDINDIMNEVCWNLATLDFLGGLCKLEVGFSSHLFPAGTVGLYKPSSQRWPSCKALLACIKPSSQRWPSRKALLACIKPCSQRWPSCKVMFTSNFLSNPQLPFYIVQLLFSKKHPFIDASMLECCGTPTIVGRHPKWLPKQRALHTWVCWTPSPASIGSKILKERSKCLLSSLQVGNSFRCVSR